MRVLLGSSFLDVRKRIGLDQTTMAKRLGIHRSYLSELENEKRTASGRLLQRLANLAATSAPETFAAASESRKPGRSIPVVSCANAGSAASFEELPQDWQDLLPSDCPDENAFGLILEGDSMEPKFQTGDVVVLMPQLPPRTNSLVAARIVDQGVVFKMLTLMNGGRRLRLTSYNPVYPPLDLRADELAWMYPAYEIRRRLWR